MSHDQLLGQGIHPSVATKLTEMETSEMLKIEELDDRAIEALKEFSEEDALKVVEQFSKKDLSHIQNKSAFLCGVMKTFRAKKKKGETVEEDLAGPDEEKVNTLLSQTGYSLEITSGQRKYGGPPPGWEGPSPGCGEEKFCSQLFVGKIPRDMFEDELIPMFAEHGTLYDFRLMIDIFSGANKGFAFCTYTTKDEADAAVKALNDKEVRGGNKLGVCISQANNRLFVGNMPKTKTKEEIMEEFKQHVEEITDVIMYMDPADRTKNRGFFFLEFNSHKDAAMARRSLMSGRIKVFGNITPTVDWAATQDEPDEETMAKVKVAYVKNVAAAVDETKLTELFKEYGAVESVKKIKDYAFVHFEERDHAVKAIEEMNGKEVEGLALEVTLAKPQGEKRRKKGQSGFGSLNTSRGGSSGPRGRGFRGGFRGGPRGRGAPYPGPYGGYGGYGAYDYGYDYYGGYPPYPPMMRGGGAPRGPRGGPRGSPSRGMARGAGAPKRKMDYGQEAGAAKKPYGADPWGMWGDYSQGWYDGGYDQQWN